MIFKAILLTGCLFFAGCGYELRQPANSIAQTNQNANRQSDTTGSAVNSESKLANSKAETGDTGDGKLILSGTGDAVSYPCNGREVEIVEDATANTYTLTGECKKLTVRGVSNKINVEKVGEIVVDGISNKVVYTEGIGGKPPKIKKSGTSTSVESQKSVEEKNNPPTSRHKI